ncbi:sensor histidine kinase [Bryobacter aggregatus]|uniref:sensor histidine kinase n=1 Tax=Bryobacter aggregatus TaxID=360054 RepID=UPI00056C9680|nr:ATP-binding protein [Bryobacter aggregatus]
MKLAHERRIQLYALAAGLPAILAVFWLIWTGDYTPKVQWTISAVLGLCWLGFSNAVREQVASPLRTVANLLEAIREGDYSIRGRSSVADDSLGEVLQQVNEMGSTLQEQRLGALEATALLRKVMEEINVAIFAFDGESKLRLVNKGGEALLGRPMERLLGETAESLGLEDCLRGEMRTMTRSFPGGSGRWGVGCSTFREGGVPHQLLVLTDLTRPLREEELQAWQRLVRVLGHELNNSLAPIKSIAGSLANIVDRDPLPEDWKEDMQHGLHIIGSRAESLQRFLSAYTRLAKLPRPSMTATPIEPLVRRAVALELRKKVEILPGPSMVVDADADQVEQVLINLIKNAVEAAQVTGGAVRVGWERTALLAGPRLEVWIEDEGPGLANTANLFVPFFTTKPGGSGIGLVLCRQIAEAHGGTLELRNNEDKSGCTARFFLPLVNHDSAATAVGDSV